MKKLQEQLILRKSFRYLLKTWIKLLMGRIIAIAVSSFEFYKDANFKGYEFKGKELPLSYVEEKNNYVSKILPIYRQELEYFNIEKTSQYYSYSRIKEFPVKVCNIGCFYCKADSHFLKVHPKNVVYGLDFGNIIESNKEFVNKRLKLFEGYPLKTLEKLNKENERFNYTLFTRTATLLNINELLSYMKLISTMSSNVVFLEPLKLITYTKTEIDLNKIDIINPQKMYCGMYIHNYAQILRKFDYEIVESRILPRDLFENNLTPDHYFIYVHGRKEVK